MAYTEAINNGSGGSGVLAPRSNATRSGAFNRARVCVAFNGTQRNGIEKSSLSLSFEMGDAAEASFTFKGGSGYVPTRGHTLVVGHGTVDNVLFSGRIVSVSRMGARAAEKRPTYQVEAIDRTFDLRRQMAGGIATSLTPSQFLISKLTGTGITPSFIADTWPVQASFPPWPVPLSTVLDQVAEQVGGARWYVDQRARLHFYDRADNDPMLFPSISTLTLSSGAYGITQDVDLSGVVTRVRVLGARAKTLEPVYQTDGAIPVDTVEGLYDPFDATSIFPAGRLGYRLQSGVKLNIGGYLRDLTTVEPISVISGQPVLAESAPVSVTANSFYVVRKVDEFVFATEDYRIDVDDWVTLAGVRFFVASIDVFSFSGNSVASDLFVPMVGVGAPATVPEAAIPPGALLERADPVLRLSTLGLTASSEIVPAGTVIRTDYTLTNTPVLNAVSSIVGSYPYHMETIIDDPTLSAAGVLAAASLAVAQGDPGNFVRYTVRTRDQNVVLGQTVHLAVSSVAESGALPMTGSYVVESLEIGEFDDLSDRFGPIRSAHLAKRKPANYFRALAALDADRKRTT